MGRMAMNHGKSCNSPDYQRHNHSLLSHCNEIPIAHSHKHLSFGIGNFVRKHFDCLGTLSLAFELQTSNITHEMLCSQLSELRIPAISLQIPLSSYRCMTNGTPWAREGKVEDILKRRNLSQKIPESSEPFVRITF
jgi:hypothetical protein